MKTLVVLAAVVLLAVGCGRSEEAPPTVSNPSSSASSEPVDMFGTGVITGKILFKGIPPKPDIIRMNADPYCQSMHDGMVTNEDVLVNVDGTLCNVFVYVKQGIKGDYTPPAEPAVIDQKGCLYHPRIQGLQVGQPLIIRNSDDTLHNIHALADVNSPFNLGQPTRGMESRKIFTQPEVMIHFKCDVHPWMNGYLGVLKHPFFAVTGNDGMFTLPKLPPGEYVVEAWHQVLGRQQQTLTLAKDETKTVEFAFTN